MIIEADADDDDVYWMAQGEKVSYANIPIGTLGCLLSFETPLDARSKLSNCGEREKLLY